jgi:hypothetical protein
VAGTGRLRDWLMNNEVLSVYQAVFVNGSETMNNIFVIKITTDKYL